MPVKVDQKSVYGGQNRPKPVFSAKIDQNRGFWQKSAKPVFPVRIDQNFFSSQNGPKLVSSSQNRPKPVFFPAHTGGVHHKVPLPCGPYPPATFPGLSPTARTCLWDPDCGPPEPVRTSPRSPSFKHRSLLSHNHPHSPQASFQEPPSKA